MLGLNLSLGLGSLDGRTLTQRALAAIKRAGGTVLLSGLPRNYFDSVGTTPARVDQPVGLVLDGAGTVGPERRQDFVTGVGGTATAATYDTATGAGSVTRVDLSNQSFVRITGLTASKSYRLSITNTGAVAVNIRQLDYAGSAVATVAAGASGECVFTGNANCVITAAGGTATFTLNEFRELTGNHATQATTGSKPTLRRGLVNQLRRSGEFVTNDQWTVTGLSSTPTTGPDGSTSATTLTVTNASSALASSQITPVVASSTEATVAYILKANGDANTRPLLLRNGTTATNFQPGIFNQVTGEVTGAGWSSTALGSDWYLITFTQTSGISIGNTLLLYAGFAGGPQVLSSTFVIHRAAIFAGTVTAQQILAAGGIPLTTTAPASSALGNYWWQFDPAAPGDFLQTGITTWNEGWVCAGVRQTAATTCYPVASGGLVDSMAGMNFRLINGVTPQILVCDGTLRQVLQADANVILGTPFVYSGGWNGADLLLGVDATEKVVARTRNPTSTTITTIGAADNTGAGVVNGALSVVVRCPTLPPSADRALIRAWVAKQQGQTL